MQRAPASDIELRNAYSRSGLQALGISFDHAVTSSDLYSLLSLLVCRERRHAERPQRRPAFVSRIERTAGYEQPDLFTFQE